MKKTATRLDHRLFFLQHFFRFCVCNIANSPKCLQHVLLQHSFSRQKVCNNMLCNMSKKTRNFMQHFFATKMLQKFVFATFVSILGMFWKIKKSPAGSKISTKDGSPSQSKLFNADSTSSPLNMQYHNK